MNLVLNEKIKYYQKMYNLINPLNLDLLRRVSWTLAKLYFKKSVTYMDKNEYNQQKHNLARSSTESARQHFEKYREITENMAKFS